MSIAAGPDRPKWVKSIDPACRRTTLPVASVSVSCTSRATPFSEVSQWGPLAEVDRINGTRAGHVSVTVWPSDWARV